MNALISLIFFFSSICPTTEEIWNSYYRLNGGETRRLSPHNLSGYNLLTKAQYENFLKLLFQNATMRDELTIYDFGCGAGSVLNYVNTTWNKTTLLGCDRSNEATAKAKLFVPQAELYTYDLCKTDSKIPAAKNILVDIGVAFGLIANLTDEETAKQVLKKILNFVRPLGTLIIADVADQTMKDRTQYLCPTLTINELALSKSFFESLAAEERAKCVILDQSEKRFEAIVPGCKGRYSVILTKLR